MIHDLIIYIYRELREFGNWEVAWELETWGSWGIWGSGNYYLIRE